MTPNTAAAFQEKAQTTPPPSFNVVASERDDQIMQMAKEMKQAEIDTPIFQAASRPAIFICEDVAESYGGMASYIMECVPGAAIIFENKAAACNFSRAPFALGINFQCAAKHAAPQADYDVIAVFGTPRATPHFFAGKTIIGRVNFGMIAPPALHKLKGIINTPYAAEFLSEDDKKDPKKVKRAEGFTKQRMEAVADLQKALGMKP